MLLPSWQPQNLGNPGPSALHPDGVRDVREDELEDCLGQQVTCREGGGLELGRVLVFVDLLCPVKGYALAIWLLFGRRARHTVNGTTKIVAGLRKSLASTTFFSFQLESLTSHMTSER